MTTDESNEAAITVDGVLLSLAEAMTVRVALGAYVSEMAEDGLGDDDRGKAIAAGYVHHGSVVLGLIHRAIKAA